MSEHTGDAQAIVDAAVESTHPAPLDETTARFWALRTTTGGVQIIDLSYEQVKNESVDEHPGRKAGHYTVRTADSFVAYLDRHATTLTEVWADHDERAIRAVIDSHGSTLAGHGDHVVELRLRPTPAWKAWTAHDRALLPQSEFAEHVEDRLPDFVRPTAAEFLELAQTFKALKKVDFESAHRLKSGQTAIEYREQTNATAGRKGQLDIPDDFELALAPFEGAATYKVTARLRYRIDGSTLYLGYLLDRIDDVLKAAFDDVVDEVAEGIEPVIFTGWPA